MSSRIVMAMSGGVDSSVAAARLVDEGHQVVGVTLHLWDEPDDLEPSAIRDARRVAHQLGIPHHVLDQRELFAQQVVEPFVDAYLSGSTPSPCATCNWRIKIPALERVAQSMGAEAVATGHYARVVAGPAGLRIARGSDPRKDQSYFLCMLGQQSLRRLLLPLGCDTKRAVRGEALERGLEVAHRQESQDLCFVSDGDYGRFVRERAGNRVLCGWIVDAQGKRLARHDGIHRFTLGQRKGVGVAVGRPVFVVRVDASSGDVVVGDESAVMVRRVVVAEPTLGAGVQLPCEALVQVRYRHEGVPARLVPGDHGALEVHFERPVRAPSPGQYAVGYCGDEVIAGGIIVGLDGSGPTAVAE